MLSVIFKARKFVKGFLRGFLPQFDPPRHLKIESSPPPPPGCLGCPKNRPSVPPCRKQGLIPQRTIS